MNAVLPVPLADNPGWFKTLKVVPMTAVAIAVTGVAVAILNSQMFFAVGFALLGICAAYCARTLRSLPERIVEMMNPYVRELGIQRARIERFIEDLDELQENHDQLEEQLRQERARFELAHQEVVHNAREARQIIAVQADEIAAHRLAGEDNRRLIGDLLNRCQ